MSVTVAPGVLALVRGEHSDPFAILGPHPLGTLEDEPADPAGGLAVRAFIPGVESARVLPAAGGPPPRGMTSLHPAGFFDAPFPGVHQRFAYRLEIRDRAGRVTEVEDPYRFPSTLSDFDLQLLGE